MCNTTIVICFILIILFIIISVYISKNYFDKKIEILKTADGASIQKTDSLRKDVKKIIKKAKSFIGEDNDRAEYLFLNAIYHDPDNVDNYNAYIDFLDSTGRNDERLDYLLNIVDSAIVQADTVHAEQLYALYQKLRSERVVDLEDSDVDSEENASFLEEEAERKLSEAITSFYGYYNTYKYEVYEAEDFNSLYNQVVLAYADVQDSPKFDDEYQKITEINGYKETYLAFCNTYENLMFHQKGDSFILAFDSAASFLSSAVNVFTSRNKTNTSFDTINATTCNDIIKKLDSLYSMYDSIRVNNLQKKVENLYITDINSNISSLKLKELLKKYKEIQYDFSLVSSSLFTTKYTDKVIGISSFLSDYYEKLYNLAFSNYQVWAAEKISSLAAQADRVKQENKLYMIYRDGFGEINPSLLIPQIKTLYDSLYKKSASKTNVEEKELIKTWSSGYRDIWDID